MPWNWDFWAFSVMHHVLWTWQLKYHCSVIKIWASSLLKCRNETENGIEGKNTWIFQFIFTNYLNTGSFFWHDHTKPKIIFHLVWNTFLKTYQTHWNFATCLELHWYIFVCEISCETPDQRLTKLPVLFTVNNPSWVKPGSYSAETE